MADPDWLAGYAGAEVVIDTDAGYLVIGRLDRIGPDHLELAEADLHDHAEANSTKEVYVIESQRLGVRVNRRRVSLVRARLIAISRLDEIAR